jgi:GR25 family glycosyltransferase involved in LPS biosynthesis
MNFPRTFVLTVRRPIKRFDDTVKHLDEIGIKWERFDGMDNKITRLQAVDTFDVDRAGERLEVKHVAATLTHYLLWKVMQYQPDESFVALEFDVRFVEGWKQRYELAMRYLPSDWDLVYLGSCCCQGRETSSIDFPIGSGGTATSPSGLYDVRYPLCGHAIMYRKKCLETLLEVHQKINMPLDIAMYHLSLPKLRVYTILPTIVTQHNTFLPP